jgi:pyridoxal/pyridoxine/pyridoxamine kinase
MKRPVARVAAIHDLSGFGRASLTVIIPILSTMGAQVCPLPTAVLSTHTGGFQDYRIMDLSTHMRSMIEHAKIITPNFTESCFLLEREYSRKIDPGELKEWLIRLSDFGPSTVTYELADW